MEHESATQDRHHSRRSRINQKKKGGDRNTVKRLVLAVVPQVALISLNHTHYLSQSFFSRGGASFLDWGAASVLIFELVF